MDYSSWIKFASFVFPCCLSWLLLVWSPNGLLPLTSSRITCFISPSPPFLPLNLFLFLLPHLLLSPSPPLFPLVNHPLFFNEFVWSNKSGLGSFPWLLLEGGLSSPMYSFFALDFSGGIFLPWHKHSILICEGFSRASLNYLFC